MAQYSIGLDYGTNSLRAVLVNVSNGSEVAAASAVYPHGADGVILSDDPNLARQHPADYVKTAETVLKRVVSAAKRKLKSFRPQDVVGIGVGATGSTPLPVGRTGSPLAFESGFADDLNAMAWLWKDHTAIDEAEEITAQARKLRPRFLGKYGGVYGSEWFFSKILHVRRTCPKVFDAAWSWVELSDWIPAALTGTESPEDLSINICAAGHKAMFSDDWGGYPDEKFLASLDPKLGELRTRLKSHAKSIGQPVGGLTKDWAKKTKLPAGIPVSAGALDAHLGAVGCGIQPGTLARIIGTSACDMIVAPDGQKLPDIPGVCGIVEGSIVPGLTGIEAGQSAVGDIYNWFTQYIQPGGKQSGSHTSLTKEALKLAPGQSGLLALDWNHGNRCVLVDPRLTGLLLGQTLYTTGAEIYRALIEATAFGALTIIQRLEQYHVQIDRIVACGGIAEKNPLVMQILSDVTARPIHLSRSANACALGAAITGAVAGGAHESIHDAQQSMTGLKKKSYAPNPAAGEIYKKLYRLYKQLHDVFGTTTWKGNCHNVMKELLDIRTAARNGS